MKGEFYSYDKNGLNREQHYWNFDIVLSHETGHRMEASLGRSSNETFQFNLMYDIWQTLHPGRYVNSFERTPFKLRK